MKLKLFTIFSLFLTLNTYCMDSDSLINILENAKLAVTPCLGNRSSYQCSGCREEARIWAFKNEKALRETLQKIRHQPRIREHFREQSDSDQSDSKSTSVSILRCSVHDMSAYEDWECMYCGYIGTKHQVDKHIARAHPKRT